MSDFNLTSFWKNDDIAGKEYVGATITQEMILSVQKRLGFRLPPTYIELLRIQNGGIPKKNHYQTSQPTSWAQDHIAITGIFGLDHSKALSLCGELGSEYWKKEWGYPDIGIYFADCPSAGHDLLCFDYRNCLSDAEPKVVHVDQELNYKITLISDDFETFICGLK
ncbi:MAG: SMI1/KNR4 family protein [Deltaproteobacteria bacterium]|nr:SMI1/KNR4 family protein [Deltaproteobacteria bacterium]